MKLSVLFTLIFFSFQLHAQVIKEKDYPNNRLSCHYIELEAAPGLDSIALPFSHVQIMDLRPDTSKYGYFRHPQSFKQFKYCFKNGVRTEVTEFANTYLANNTSASKQDYVLMCLRRLWVTRDDTIVVQKAAFVNRIKILLKADFYLHSNNSFHPLYRIDTILARESLRRVNADGLVEEALSAALQKLKKMDYEHAANARSITEADIKAYYERLNNIPALTANKIAKGVYRSFEEFKQNRPSDTAFEIKFESLADHLYVKDKNGNQYLDRKVWGVSDGETVYIRLNENFFPLFRHQNTWELYTVKVQEFRMDPASASRYSSSPGAALLSAAVAAAINNAEFSSKKLIAYQLDLDTGKIF